MCISRGGKGDFLVKSSQNLSTTWIIPEKTTRVLGPTYGQFFFYANAKDQEHNIHKLCKGSSSYIHTGDPKPKLLHSTYISVEQQLVSITQGGPACIAILILIECWLAQMIMTLTDYPKILGSNLASAIYPLPKKRTMMNLKKALDKPKINILNTKYYVLQ